LYGELEVGPWDERSEEAASTDPSHDTSMSNRFSCLRSGNRESKMAILMSVESSPEESGFGVLGALAGAAPASTLD
jgi:hypothetical protein